MVARGSSPYELVADTGRVSEPGRDIDPDGREIRGI
jgi:hypothetical protein